MVGPGANSEVAKSEIASATSGAGFPCRIPQVSTGALIDEMTGREEGGKGKR